MERRPITCRLVGLLALVLLAGPAAAQTGHVEDFTSLAFADTVSTIALWDTAAGRLTLPPFVSTFRGSYDTPHMAFDVDFAGSYAFVADGLNGLVIIDTRNQDLPALIGSYDTPGMAMDVEVRGDLTFVADAVTGLLVLDTSNVNLPSLVGSLDTPGTADRLCVDGDLVLLADGSAGLQFIDVSDPALPVLSATHDTPGDASAAAVAGDRAYIADGSGGLRILDISDPAAPVLLGVLDTAGFAADVAVAGRHAFLADGANGFVVVDVTDPTAPALAGHCDTPGTALSLAVSGDHVYVADYTVGVQVVDITDPTAPFVEETLPAAPARGLDLFGARLGITAESQGLLLATVADRVGPVAAGSLAPGSDVYAVCADGDEAFLAGTGFHVADVTDVTSPSLIGTTATNNAAAVAVAGDFAYAAHFTTGLRVYDVSDRSAPLLVATLDVGGTAEGGLVVRGDLVYAAVPDVGLVIVDVTDPTLPAIAGTLAVTGAWGVDVAGDLAYVASILGDLHLVDVSVAAAPATLGSLYLGGNPQDVHAAGDLAYVIDSTGYMHIVNTLTPSAPFQVSFVGTAMSGAPVAMDVSGDLVFVADGQLGLTVLSVASTSGNYVGNLDLPGYTRDVHVAGGVAYVANSTNGLQAVQVRQRDRLAYLSRAQSLQLNPRTETVARVRLSTTPADVGGWRAGDPYAGPWTDVPTDNEWMPLTTLSNQLFWQANLDWAPGADPFVDEVRLEWLYEAPLIEAVSDIPGDQGRQVRVEWSRSGHDFADAAEQIVEYAVYRRIDPGLAAAKVAEGPAPRLLRQSPVVRDDAAAKLAASWDFLTAVPVRLEDRYAVVVPTLADSTIAGGQRFSTFMVSALTATPGRFFDSPADSGYSVDDLAPGVPTGITAAYGAGAVVLDWADAPEEDFAHFRVYRSTTPGFAPGPEDLAHETAASTWTDPSADAWDQHYLVAAVDHAGNEGPAGAPSEVSGAGADAPPVRFALGEAVPNPFNPSATIGFAVPEHGRVRLAVYDLGGRRVRTLVDGDLPAGAHTAAWDGRGDTGQRVPSGVYFYRLRAGSRSAAGRMVLVK